MEAKDDHPEEEEDTLDQENLSLQDELSDEEEDLYETYRKEKAKLRSAQAKREFFSGIKFQMRTDSIQINLNSIKRQIVRDAETYPNLHFVINNMCLKLLFNNEDLAIQNSVREIMIFDYYRNEKSQDVVGYLGTELLDTAGDEEDWMQKGELRYRESKPEAPYRPPT